MKKVDFSKVEVFLVRSQNILQIGVNLSTLPESLTNKEKTKIVQKITDGLAEAIKTKTVT